MKTKIIALTVVLTLAAVLLAQTDSYRGRIPIIPSTGEPNYLAAATYLKQEQFIDVRWYGATGVGAPTDDSTAIQAALDAASASGGGRVLLPVGDYFLGTTALTIPDRVSVIGHNAWESNLIYTGHDSALVLDACGFNVLADFGVDTSGATDANGIQLTNACRHCEIRNVALVGDTTAANTGTAVHFLAGTGWTGHIPIRNLYAVGYKYGIRLDSTGGGTITTVQCYDCKLAGRSAGVIAGSAGVSFDAGCDGVGTTFIGGAIESYATGILHADGGYGGSFWCDMEGNTADYSVGASWDGEIVPAFGGRWYYQDNQSVGVVATRASLVSGGSAMYEWLYTPKWTIYEGSSAVQQFTISRGDSQILGGSPQEKFALSHAGNGDNNPQSNWLRWGSANGRKVAWSSAAPVAGTWVKGDVVLNSDADAGESMGWVCTVAGTPGTWGPIGMVQSASLAGVTKTITKSIDLDDDASTDDYQFDDDAANTTEQVITLSGILPARATLMDWQIYCIEGADDANTVTVDFGTTSGGFELGTGAPDDLDEMISMAAGASPALAPTNAARSLYVGATPSANWNVMHSLWRIEVVISYIDNLAAHTQKNP